MSATEGGGRPQTINAADEILQPPLMRGRGNDIAILFGDERISFRELNARVNRFGNALKPRLAKDDRVLLLLKDSPDFVAAYLGIMRIGAVAVPLSTRLSAQDLAFVIADSGAKVLLIDDEFLPLYRQAVASAGRRVGLVVVRGAAEAGMQTIPQLLSNASTELQSAPTTADDMAFWLYTSGTTGKPKGAVHCHGDVVIGDYYMQAFGFGPGERIFSSSKLFFAFALAHALIGALRTGSTVILYDGWPDSEAIAAVVERYRPTVMLSVPAFFRNLLRDNLANRPGFKSVRCYLSAGEALPESLYRRWYEATGAPIVDGLGATETMFMIIGGTPAEHRPGATGKPLPYAEVRLLDQEGRPVVKADTPGILWVRMGSLCRGYWRQPDKTNASFRDGWFRTGDVYIVDREGWWIHQGRADDLLKISGQWVSPAEIEACATTVPGVAEAIVVGAQDADGLTRLNMFLIAPDGGGDALQRQVQEKLLATLSKYKCPRRIMFVDAVPRTATGKIQRFRLRNWISADFLPRLMRALNLDLAKLASAEPQLVRAMQGKCVMCEHHDRCMSDLDQDRSASTFQDYCPNADVLISLRIAARPN